MLKQKISPKLISLILGVLVVCFAIGFYVYAWTEPAVSPPNNNIGAPINVSVNSQTKGGSLTFVGDVTATSFIDRDNASYFIDSGGSFGGYSAILEGKVGIGTLTPGYQLEVVGGTTETADGLIIEKRSSDPPAGERYEGRIWLISP